ncbi:MAG: hypothetical protein JNL97_04185, partial [Verrucomicrobiales bacterium]|nr:hypothetical protein [Verrucomicrobiales bacterium]
MGILGGSVQAQPEFLREAVEWRGSPEWRAMDDAFRDGDEARILELMAAHPEVGRAYSPPFTSALAWAAGTGATNLLATLIGQGALERERTRGDLGPGTAVRLAVETGWASCLEMLLKAGADPNGGEGPWPSPLEQAIQSRGGGGGRFGMRNAPSYERDRVIRLLMGAGANLFAPRYPTETGRPSDYFVGYPVDTWDLVLTNA